MKRSNPIKPSRMVARALKAAEEWNMYFRSDDADYMAFAIPRMALELAKLRAEAEAKTE